MTFAASAFLRRRLPVLLAALAFLISTHALPVFAQDSQLSIGTEAGLDGYCKSETWLPVRITLENTGGDNLNAQLAVETDSDNPQWLFTVETALPSISRKEVTVYIMPQRFDREVRVTLQQGTRTLVTAQAAINCVDRQDPLYGVWAANPSIFNPQTDVQLNAGRASLVRLDERSLPDRAEGFAMLDALTISDADTSRLTQAQRAALSSWVSGGGVLLVAGGPDWQRTSGGLEGMLPLRPSGTRTLASLDNLRAFSSAGGPLTGPAVAAAGDLAPDARILAAQDGVPLIVARTQGYGTVVYFTVDPALEPLRTWPGIVDVYQVLLGSPGFAPDWRHGFQEWSDASEALNAVPGLGLPPTLLICAFILFYVVAVGPANYFALRMVRKRELAWVSIPLIAISATGLILLFSSTLFGSRPIVNRLSIVQIWDGQDQAALDGLVGVFSPARDRYVLGSDSGLLAHPLPSPGFGANPGTKHIEQTDTGFRTPDLQVDIGGLESFVVSGQLAAPRFEYSLKATPNSPLSILLTGEFRNRSGFTLEDAVLLTNQSNRSLGNIADGDNVSLSITAASLPTGQPGIVGSTDDTLSHLFGTNYMYPSRSTDIELYRRFNLLSAALGGPLGSRGDGIFLLGWSRRAPFETSLSGGLERDADTTLFIIQLTPDID